MSHQFEMPVFNVLQDFFGEMIVFAEFFVFREGLVVYIDLPPGATGVGAFVCGALKTVEKIDGAQKHESNLDKDCSLQVVDGF
ncbi:MAG: hypothetical protein HUK20_04785 [Fibrobacter sp.]|nr:hypothetical protein [Fibrobacter sp.]